MSIEKRKYELKSRAEAQRQTRERIVLATMDLHREVGPAQTTVAEVARRAGVQRLTVYNNFPDEAELFGACQAHWMELHPLPDLDAALAVTEPAERLRAALRGTYRWYRETQPMAENIQRDRTVVPALDSLMRRTADARADRLADALAEGLGAGAARPGTHPAGARLLDLAPTVARGTRRRRGGRSHDGGGHLVGRLVGGQSSKPRAASALR